MKLDYRSLKAIKPDIILTTAAAFGGPESLWSDQGVGFDGARAGHVVEVRCTPDRHR